MATHPRAHWAVDRCPPAWTPTAARRQSGHLQPPLPGTPKNGADQRSENVALLDAEYEKRATPIIDTHAVRAWGRGHSRLWVSKTVNCPRPCGGPAKTGRPRKQRLESAI